MTANIPRPSVAFVDGTGIPQELRDIDQWIAWRYELRGNDWSKIPINPNKPATMMRAFFLASTTNAATWGTLNAALAFAAYYGMDGIGFVFTDADPYVGIDLDHVRDLATGDIEPWALDVVREIDSHCELSVSDSGIHIIARGKLPGHGLHPPRSQIEIYDQGRYFTFSGRPIEDRPIADRASEIDAFYLRISEQFYGPPRAPQQPLASNGNGAYAAPALSDDEVVERAGDAANGDRFRRLMAGDTGDYGGDDSAADAALCEALAFWTGGDQGQVDRIFRTSGLMRPKWDSKQPAPYYTYGGRTIEFAFGGKTSFYKPSVGYTIVPPPQNSHAVKGSDPLDDDDNDNDFRKTDYGNAERLVSSHGADLHYCASFGKWLAWDGCRFGIDQDEAVMRVAKATIREIYREAAALDDRNARVTLAGHAKRSEALGRIRAMVTLAQSEASIAIVPEQLDQNHWILNVKNGTLDLRTGTLRAHSRDDMITKLAPVPYQPDATCPTWEAFLEQVLPSEQVRQFIQRAFGYSLTGITRERVILILYGIGANGKSTFLEVCRQILGDYAMTTTSETFLAKHEGAIPNDVARLKGARFVTAVEADEGKRLAEAQIKQMAGGSDAVSARFMRGEWFDFLPEFKAWLATNHKPVIRGTDDGIWDRIRLVSFPVRIPDDLQDKGLGDKLRVELPGIMAWAVRGCLAWQQGGLGITDEVRTATSDYRAEMNVLGHFIDDRCEVEPGSRVAPSALYKAYTGWCETSGERPVSQINVGKRLAEMGFTAERDTKSRWWCGLRLQEGGFL